MYPSRIYFGLKVLPIEVHWAQSVWTLRVVLLGNPKKPLLIAKAPVILQTSCIFRLHPQLGCRKGPKKYNADHTNLT